MSSTAINWERIESCFVYGGGAPVVFIGMEEGLADKSALKNDLIRRS
jgi:hypothetical protein